MSCALCSAATSARRAEYGRPRHARGRGPGIARAPRRIGSSPGGSARGRWTGDCWPHPGGGFPGTRSTSTRPPCEPPRSRPGHRVQHLSPRPTGTRRVSPAGVPPAPPRASRAQQGHPDGGRPPERHRDNARLPEREERDPGKHPVRVPSRRSQSTRARRGRPGHAFAYDDAESRSRFLPVRRWRICTCGITVVPVGIQLNVTSLKSMLTISMSRMGRRSGPRV